MNNNRIHIKAPKEVTESLQELIDENFDGIKSVFSRDQFVKKIIYKLPLVTESEILLGRWVDVGFQFYPKWNFKFHGSLVPNKHKLEFILL